MIVKEGTIRAKMSFYLNRDEKRDAKRCGFKRLENHVISRKCTETNPLRIGSQYYDCEEGDGFAPELFFIGLYIDHILHNWGYPIDYLIVEHLALDGSITEIDL